jgi:hypothetical protein
MARFIGTGGAPGQVSVKTGRRLRQWNQSRLWQVGMPTETARVPQGVTSAPARLKVKHRERKQDGENAHEKPAERRLAFSACWLPPWRAAPLQRKHDAATR